MLRYNKHVITTAKGHERSHTRSSDGTPVAGWERSGAEVTGNGRADEHAQQLEVSIEFVIVHVAHNHIAESDPAGRSAEHTSHVSKSIEFLNVQAPQIHVAVAAAAAARRSSIKARGMAGLRESSPFQTRASSCMFVAAAGAAGGKGAAGALRSSAAMISSRTSMKAGRRLGSGSSILRITSSISSP